MKWIFAAALLATPTLAEAREIDSALVGSAIAELEVKTTCAQVVDAIASLEGTQTDEQVAISLAFISFTTAMKAVDGPNARDLLGYCQSNPSGRFIDFPR